MPRKRTFAARHVQVSGRRSGRRRKCVEDGLYVVSIRNGNGTLGRNIRIVPSRFSSRCVVRDFGFCDLNSLKNFLTRFSIVRFFTLGFQLTNLVSTPIPTNLFQRVVELLLGSPVNVCRLTEYRLGSNVQKEF